MINLVSKKRFLILQTVLEKKEFTQYGLKKELKLGMSIVNDTINTLLEKEFLKKQAKKYVLVDKKGLLELIAFLKPINKAVKHTFSTSLTKKEVEAKLSKNVVFCLETALEQYTNYYESNRVAAYASKQSLEKIKKEFFTPGSTTKVMIFAENPPLTKKEINAKHNFNYTSAIRTVIDLYCDNKGFLADKIIEKVK